MRTLTAIALIAATLTMLSLACTSRADPAGDQTQPPTQNPIVSRQASAILPHDVNPTESVPTTATLTPHPTTTPATTTHTPHPDSTSPPPATATPTAPPTLDHAGLLPPPPPSRPTAAVLPITRMPPQSLIGTLSPQERTCLGDKITTDAELIAALNDTLLTPAGTQMDCLSDDSQFQLYMISTDADDELAETTHRCIWNALIRLPELETSAEDDPQQAMAIFGKVMMLIVTVPLYCVATEQPDLASLAEMEGADAVDQFICMIEAAGGLEGWTSLLLGEDQAFADHMERTDKECAQPKS